MDKKIGGQNEKVAGIVALVCGQNEKIGGQNKNLHYFLHLSIFFLAKSHLKLLKKLIVKKQKNLRWKRCFLLNNSLIPFVL